MPPELIAQYHCNTGEGPAWLPHEQSLYWLDIPPGIIYRYHPESGRHEPFFQAGEAIGGFTLQEDNSLLLFMARGAIQILRDGRLTAVHEDIPQERPSRFNDVIADPAGRVFCGTMACAEHPGSLYRLDTDGTLTTVLTGVGCSNGMGFTPDRKRMYYIDTPTLRVDVFDYDEATGELANRRPFAHTPPNTGYPDGMTVDAEGCVWVAKWDGGRVERYSPEGELMSVIDFPTGRVSCVTFGGQDYADMYVTTAGGNDPERCGENAGALYRVRGAAIGVPEFRSRVRG